MPSLKSLKTRINSVKNTKKITSTMKMVAAAKTRRARIACEQSRPFADSITETVHGLANNISKEDSDILLTGYNSVKKARILVFGSDRGLCGSFNEQLLKEVDLKIKELTKKEIQVEILAFGNKVRDGLKVKHPELIKDVYSDFYKIADFTVFKNIADELTSDFKANEIQEVYVAYNQFVNMLTQKPTLTLLAPLAIQEEKESSINTSDIILEPNVHEVLTTLLPRFMASNINQSYLESFASEQACRMTAMEGSTKNASEVINKLSLLYNRQRQANITNELVEIISGAQALNN